MVVHSFSGWGQILWNESKTKLCLTNDTKKCKLYWLPISFSVSNIELKARKLRISVKILDKIFDQSFKEINSLLMENNLYAIN